MICGIYKITSPSGKIYIGQSRNILVRYKHYKNLRCKYQPRVYNSIVKHGWSNHTFEIIEECSLEDLNDRERYHQELYDVLGDKGLNCNLVDTTEKPKVYSEESIRLKKEGHPTAEKVIDRITLEIYNSIADAAKANGIGVATLEKQLAGKFKSKTNLIKYSDYIDGVYLPEYINRIINTETGVVYETLTDATKSINMSCTTLFYQIKGIYKNKTPFEYLSMYTKGEKVISKNRKSKKVIDTATGIVYESIKQASETFGINMYTLSDYLRGKVKNKTTLLIYEE